METKPSMTAVVAEKPKMSIRRANREWIAELTIGDRQFVKNYGGISPSVQGLLIFAKNCGAEAVVFHVEGVV